MTDDETNGEPVPPELIDRAAECDTFSAQCRGPIDGECDNLVVLHLPFHMTGHEQTVRCRCAACGTTNTVHKDANQAETDSHT